MPQELEAAIIGAGPAGIASAIYLHRAGRDPLLIEQSEPGGLLRNANLVENYPGFPGGIKGPDLVLRFKEQLDTLGIKVIESKVLRLRFLRNAFQIETTRGDFSSASMIVASGTRPKKLLISGSVTLAGKKVFSEIVEMPLSSISGKHVVVVGGGDAAFDHALNLASRGARVTIVSRSEPVCLSLLRGRADASGVDMIFGLEVNQMRESKGKVKVRYSGNAGNRELEADYALVACGREPSTDFIDASLRAKLGSHDNIPKTNIPGLFVAGDVVRGNHRQTAIAVGDGVHAGMMADEFLRTAEAKR